MKRNLKRFNFFLKDSNKKSIISITRDILSLWILKKEFPFHYFGRFLYRKGASDPKNFMTQKQYNKLVTHVINVNISNPENSKLLDNKLLFYKHCRQHNLPSPEIISYSMGETFHFENHEYNVTNSEEFLLFFKNTLKKIGATKICLKPMDSKAGIGVIIMTIEKLTEEKDSIWEMIKNKNYIHQEVIIQHPSINDIYSKSINTIRIEAYLDSKGKNHIFGTLMRFGSKGSEVDNISQGGFFVSINYESGTLFKYGKTNLIHEGKLLAKHPDTGFTFENFKIPFFEESIKLVKEATLKTPGYVYAWDIGITPYGPTIIEGNNYPSFTTGELSYGGYKNRIAFKEIFNEANIKYL